MLGVLIFFVSEKKLIPTPAKPDQSHLLIEMLHNETQRRMAAEKQALQLMLEKLHRTPNPKRFTPSTTDNLRPDTRYTEL